MPTYKCRKCSWRCGVRYFPFSIAHVALERFPCPLKNAVFQKEGLNIWQLCVVRDRRKQHCRNGLIWKHALSLCVSGFLTFVLWEKLANPKQQKTDSFFLVPVIYFKNIFRPSYLFICCFFFLLIQMLSMSCYMNNTAFVCGKQKRFLFVDSMTGGSWSIAYAGKLLSHQQSDFQRHANCIGCSTEVRWKALSNFVA